MTGGVDESSDLVPPAPAKRVPDMGIDDPDRTSAEERAAHDRWLEENRPPHHS
jgi:hypothetical protein